MVLKNLQNSPCYPGRSGGSVGGRQVGSLPGVRCCGAGAADGGASSSFAGANCSSHKEASRALGAPPWLGESHAPPAGFRAAVRSLLAPRRREDVRLLSDRAWASALHCLHYLYATRDSGIEFRSDGNQEPECYYDSGHLHATADIHLGIAAEAARRLCGLWLAVVGGHETALLGASFVASTLGDATAPPSLQP
eukprot:COSAG03_NODE_9027_length_751_cov_1.001534_1_plen_193_part_01